MLITAAEHDFACAETQQLASLSACHQLLPQLVDSLHSPESCHSLCSEDEASDLKLSKMDRLSSHTAGLPVHCSTVACNSTHDQTCINI